VYYYSTEASTAGQFPSSVLSLSNLTTLDIEYTGLTGQISVIDFGKAQKLSSLILVNNGQLGNALPILSTNSLLRTL
jgi:outer membrane protease